jgi:hypothetical protein
VNTQLALRVLGQIMDWDDDRARDEFRRLRLMASLKYDGYRDFEAGVRFIESLASWLQQFKPNERDTAYEFVTNRMVYIGPGEMEKLVGQFYTNWVRPNLVQAVAEELGIPPYLVNADADAINRIAHLRRRTLFLGLSDGARVDYIRHQNVGRIFNEQIVGSTQLDGEKWRDLLDSLQRDTGDPDARFGAVYLIDDFIATGTTFFRVDPETNKPKGKLAKFARSVESAVGEIGRQIFEEGYRINVHHYVGTAAAIDGLGNRLRGAEALLANLGLSSTPLLTCGITLPTSLPLSPEHPEDRDFLQLADRYYDPVLETVHTKVGGTDDMKLGYGGCALPLVLDHNTPNNSLPLLWAETAGAATDAREVAVPAMRPLFRRRQRHV